MSSMITVLLVGITLGTVIGALAATFLLRRPRTTVDEAWHELLTELERARRYDHPFTLVRLQPRQSGDPRALELLEQIGRSHRRTDRCWQVGDQRYLLLPETDKSGAETHLNRLLAPVDGDRVTWRSASFPDEGLTVGALLSVVQEHPAAVRRRLVPRARQAAS